VTAATSGSSWLLVLVPLGVTVVLGVIGWLFRQWAKDLSAKFDRNSEQLDGLDAKVDDGLQRLSRVEGHLGINGTPSAWAGRRW
jgi:hypothetical protein